MPRQSALLPCWISYKRRGEVSAEAEYCRRRGSVIEKAGKQGC